MLSHPDHDHRKIAQQRDLLHFQEEAPGMAFWHPNGLIMLQLLQAAARAETGAQGYLEVQTPQILRRPIWEASGHWQHFDQSMFRVVDQACDAAVKPVSCPGHIEIAKRRALSYRDLPLRLCELGVVHRDENSGSLHGLLRLRQFTQDDGHVFCTAEQAEHEIERFCRALPAFYAAFGFQLRSVAFSTRPKDRAGDEAAWDRAEAILGAVFARIPLLQKLQPGEGAFYGPKLELALEDRAGRSWQCGTIQLDLVMPQRFDLRYVDASGARQHCVMLHRALFGSLERFLGVLLEHHAPGLPAWLAPQQIAVLPVAQAQHDYALQVRHALLAAGLRASVVQPEDSLARRIAEAHAAGIPFQLVLGEREVAASAVTLRDKGQNQALQLNQAVERLAERCAAPRFGVLASLAS